MNACEEVIGMVTNDDDCDDEDPNVWIRAPCELFTCENAYINDECECTADELRTFYADADGDGVGVRENPI